MYAFSETRLFKHKIEFCQQWKKSLKNVSELKANNVAYLEEGAVTCAAEFVYVQKTHCR